MGSGCPHATPWRGLRLKLCVPDRDFYHEDEIVEILNSMTQSHSILIVLSSPFLDSYKCRFDLAQAFEQRRRHGKRVFAIKLGNIARSVLQRDAKALELVDGDRFVEWPVVGSGSSARSRRLLAKKRNKFWCKLTTELYRGMNIHQHRHHNMQTNTQAWQSWCARANNIQESPSYIFVHCTYMYINAEKNGLAISIV